MKVGFGFLAPAVIGAVLALSAVAGAKASTLECDLDDWRYRLGAATQVQCVSDNDTNTITSTFNLFGQTGWTLADKTDGGGNDIAELKLTGEKQTTETPRWTINPKGSTFQYLMITLKQSNGFGAFLIAANTLSGTWATLKGKEDDAGKSNGNNSNDKKDKNDAPVVVEYVAKNDISHASLYYIKGSTTVTPPPTTPIPLPVGAWLALTAVGGFVMLRRRKAGVTA